jgi:hypothetical protein
MNAEWFLIRDIFLGLNHKKRDFAKALELAKASKHPFAVWLSSIFPGKPPKTIMDAVIVLQQSPVNEAKTFWSYLWHDANTRLEAARNGSVLAQALNIRYTQVYNFEWLVSLSNQDDPFGLYTVAMAHRRDGNQQLAIPFLRRAAEMGHIDSMSLYGNVGYQKFDIERLKWYIPDTYATDRLIKKMTRIFPNIPNIFIHHLGHKIIKDDNSVIRKLAVGASNQCRRAVTTWILVGISLRVVRDIRRLIGKLLWKSAYRWMDKVDYMQQSKIDKYFTKKSKWC